ncbi:DUF2905 domain-containing protein [Petrotoga sp. 9PWA.NaAc.5.4]|uniref:DUF2905 domain-containing protein n=1 Tax=Petrotoga sp. 9PWA.NaAc.5.4 TaxID=1434328 RepID=UPI000CA9336B|nr:DUF2905 domain-containing protein [Petrotoga sp. 9PWA.NaAc.5.4]PNR92828.1 heme biosynthesis protein [Petrotoga sp. 9PWA.NaAc.5.4]
MQELSKFFLIVGILFVSIGIMLYFGVKLGRLPGDIIIKRDNFIIYFPITTMLLISGLISLISILIKRLF